MKQIRMADSQSHPPSRHTAPPKLPPQSKQADASSQLQTPEHEKKSLTQRALDEAWERMMESWRKHRKEEEEALKREREEKMREKRRMEKRRQQVQELVDGFTVGFAGRGM